MKLTQHIFFIGFMGTGKSSVSKLLSAETGLKRISLDQRIEEINNKTISEIFACFGEGYFRESETQTLSAVCEGSPALIDCGGGLPTKRINRNIMKKHGRSIWFKASPETIYERLKDDRSRPILQGCMSPNYIREILEKREEFYSDLADIIIETDGKTPEEICTEVLERIK